MNHKIKNERKERIKNRVNEAKHILFPINPAYLKGFLNKDSHFLCKHTHP